MTERNKMLLGGAGLLGIGALGYGVYKSRKNSSTQQPMQEKKAVNGAPRVSSTKERLARRGNLTKKADIGTALAIMGGATAAPILGHLAMRGIDSLSRKSAAQIQQDLQRILQVHPDIGKINDPRVQMAYQTLLKLNPAYAEDPLIAGPLLKQIVENRLNPMNPSSGSYIDPGVALKLTEGAQRIDNMRHPSLGVDMNKSLMSNTPDAFRAAFASNKTK
jgi:hypothetical protein